MVLKRNTLAGKNNFKLIYLVFLFYFCLVLNLNAKSNLEGTFTDIKILDKISSKNTSLKLKNGEIKKFKDLAIILPLAFLTLLFGVYPQPLLEIMRKIVYGLGWLEKRPIN